MLILGLTGSIATGKSTVSREFQEKYHIKIIDADVLARKVVEPNTPCLIKIQKEFGNEVLHEDGTLNRAKLGQAVFQDAGKRSLLNSIIHPAVRLEMLKELLRCYVRGYSIVILDVPLLFEAKMQFICWKTICVSCDKSIQKQRLLARNPELTAEDAENRVQAQMPLELKCQLADIVIENNSDLETLYENIHNVLPLITPSYFFTLLCLILPPLQITLQVIAFVSQKKKVSEFRKHI
ncbi:dephospho-CoA kinase [Schizosaccharomyces pombe]|uniref:Uncharacterized protein C14G10.01 n=1 Tax=Schizosaccharomyces pombe (strain 972 / ATCC 24843) TaxID=284812 RepID=YJL1_SCHPO|nr:putative dephospho-CoA kinase [Schizosaccharomyces pombe]O74414.1 RecName: Full=Uncharacterized protein C14G10.01 [Schizosaccharomyces pombe 972h-]CAB52159.1 dephospho-CoA kinase (predicted) [Schizosaccharomyces pombe]|eukprot:NP_587942.1 putative dephospho-CoA kinase [Schizosaccharomyces pombe]